MRDLTLVNAGVETVAEVVIVASSLAFVPRDDDEKLRSERGEVNKG